MPGLLHSLQTRDLGHLRIVAGLWGVDLKSTESGAAREELAAALLNPEAAREMADSLPPDARAALEALAGAGGRIPWAAFARRFGEVREVGPARRDREQVWLRPVSAAEALFYRALLARAFFDTPAGPQEFAYIPDDLLPLLTQSPKSPDSGADSRPAGPVGEGSSPVSAVLGRAALPREHVRVLPACDRLLDDAVTLLAALRLGIEPPETIVPVNVVGNLLQAAGIISPSPQGGAAGGVHADRVKKFLEMPRPDALSLLANAWRESETFNELRQIPALVCEGEWTNSPRVARRTLLAFLNAIPKETWWSLPAFILAVKETHPDFQRPAGDYDSWFIKRASDGLYLRGFAHWDEVDGALIRYLVAGPMFWLGMVELATPAESDAVTAFLVTSPASRNPLRETGKLHVSSQGCIAVPRSVPRAARYLIARFCEWDDGRPDEYRYRVTPASLKRAAGQGLKVGQLLALLAKNAAAEIPPAFVRALKRWEARGVEARVEARTILRLARPEILEELRRSRAGRFLGEILGPTAVIVKPGAKANVLSALAEMGLLAEEDGESDIIAREIKRKRIP